MSQTSCISHPKRSRFIKIHDWQLVLCEGNVVAAALLSFFEYWHNIKLEIQSKNIRSNDIAEVHGDERSQDETTLQFHSEEELINGIQHIGKRDSVRKAINWLEGMGFISIHKNPNKRYAFDKTRYFQFHPEPINEWLSGLSNNPLSMSKNRQRSSENQSPQSENQLPQSENTSAITEITPNKPTKITSNTLPPTPQGDKERRFGFEIPEEGTPNPCATLESNLKSSVLTTNQPVTKTIPPAVQDPFFGKHRRSSDVMWDWLPDGPWKVDGKLCSSFVNAIAKRYMKDYGHDLHTAKANAQKNLRNELTNLPIEWEWYQSTYLHKAANVQTRRQAGIDTSKDEQEIVKHAAAFNELPDEMRVTQSQTAIEFVESNVDYAVPAITQSQKQTPQLESVATVADDVWDTIEQQTNQWEKQQQSQKAPDDADNPLAYKEVVKDEDRDYWAKLAQKKNDFCPVPTPVTSADIKAQVKQITQSMSMTSKNVKAAKLEERRIAFWNNQLKSGDANAIAVATKQATEAGYFIVNGQVEDVEF